MRKKFLCIIFTIFFIFFGSQLYAKNKLNVAFDSWPPFADNNDQNFGICCALVKAVLEPSGYEINYKVLPAPRIYKYLAEGQTDKIDATPIIWRNEERAKYLIFSKPFLFNSVHFFVKADSNIEYETLNKLRGFSIGVIKGYYNSSEFENAKYLKKIACDDSIQVIELLGAGRIDLGVLDKIVAETIIKKQNLNDKFIMLQKPLFESGLHFAVSKKHPEGTKIIDIFNIGLESVIKNGKYESILNSYGVSK